MTNSSRSVLGVLSLSLTLAFGLTACTANVVGGTPGEATGGNPTGGNPTGGQDCFDGCVPPTQPAAIAVKASQMGWDQGAGGSSSSSTTGVGAGGGGVDPDTLYLEFGNPAPTCANPSPLLPCDPHFGVSIGIPPALLHVGVLSLGDPGLISTFNESGPPNTPNSTFDCPFGGGSFSGTLEISAIDATSVTFSLSGTPPFDFGQGSADGTYVATRCP